MSLRVSEVAEAAQVNAETLRYYERRGLIAEPARSPGGHRLYDEQTVTTLRVIKAAQRLGFTLDEVAELLDVGRRRGPSSDFQVRAQQKLVEVDQRIADLTHIRATLLAAIDAGCKDLHTCFGNDCCPIPFVEITERNVDMAVRRVTTDDIAGRNR